MSAVIRDTWLLPERQIDHPSAERLSASVVHARRERTFLALVTIFITGIGVLVGGSLAADRTIDIAHTLAPWLDLPPLELPIAALALPLALVAANLACELYGRRRALALGRAGILATTIIVGIAAIGDAVDDRAGAAATALAYGACAVVALVVDLRVFDALRRHANGHRRSWRAAFAPLLGQALGWAAFLGAASALAVLDDGTRASAIALGAAAYGVACAIVAAPIVTAIAWHALAGALRVGRDPFAEPDEDASDAGASDAPAFVMPRRHTLPRALIVETPLPGTNRRRPFNTAEQAFFAEGDALSEQN